jgi:hypothetical protein
MASEDPDTVPTYTHTHNIIASEDPDTVATYTQYLMASEDHDTVPTYTHSTIWPVKTMTQFPLYTVPHGQ